MKEKPLKYVLGSIKEYGTGEVIISTEYGDYHILLTDEEDAIIEDLLLNESVEYVALDTENKKVVFENVFNMGAETETEIDDLDYGVDDDGIAE